MEAVTAMAIMAVIVTGVLVTLNHGMAAMVDNRAKVQAFELARENMEKLLGSDSVTDTTEFGVHELDEDIEWQTTVESFNEPVNSAMWIRAVCSASYTDRDGERQTIELTHWITDVTKAQEKQILDQKRREQEFLEDMDGNPFGDDPDGLMKYADALAEMGDYAKALDTLSQIPLTYPDSPVATAAVNKIGPMVKELVQIDPQAGNEIVPILVERLPDVPAVQKLPTEVVKWAAAAPTGDSPEGTPSGPVGDTPPSANPSTPADAPGQSPSSTPKKPSPPDWARKAPPELRPMLESLMPEYDWTGN